MRINAKKSPCGQANRSQLHMFTSLMLTCLQTNRVPLETGVLWVISVPLVPDANFSGLGNVNSPEESIFFPTCSIKFSSKSHPYL